MKKISLILTIFLSFTLLCSCAEPTGSGDTGSKGNDIPAGQIDGSKGERLDRDTTDAAYNEEETTSDEGIPEGAVRVSATVIFAGSDLFFAESGGTVYAVELDESSPKVRIGNTVIIQYTDADISEYGHAVEIDYENGAESFESDISLKPTAQFMVEGEATAPSDTEEKRSDSEIRVDLLEALLEDMYGITGLTLERVTAETCECEEHNSILAFSGTHILEGKAEPWFVSFDISYDNYKRLYDVNNNYYLFNAEEDVELTEEGLDKISDLLKNEDIH